MRRKINSLVKHAGFRKYAVNTSWLFFERIARMGLALLVGIYVIRYLGPNHFGQLSYAQSFIALFAPFAALGLDGVVVRELVRNPDGKQELLGTAFWLKVGGASLSIVAILIAEIFTNNTSQDNSFILLLSIGLFLQGTNVIDLYFQSRAQSRYIVLVQLIQAAASSFVKIGLVFVEAPLWLFVISYTFDAILLALGFLFLAKIHGLLTIFLRFKLKIALSLLRESLPLVSAGLAVALYMRIDQIMLKAMLGNNAVGQFSAALRLSEVWYFIPMAICSSVFPAIISAKANGDEIYNKRMQQLYDLMVFLSIGVAIPVTLLAAPIIGLLYGSDYDESIIVLQIHIWSGPFVFIGVAMSNWLIVEGFGKKSLYRTMIGASVNIFANLGLIPFYGAAGAAIATLFSQIAANVIYDFFDSDVHGQLKMKIRAFAPINLLRQKVE